MLYLDFFLLSYLANFVLSGGNSEGFWKFYLIFISLSETWEDRFGWKGWVQHVFGAVAQWSCQTIIHRHDPVFSVYPTSHCSTMLLLQCKLSIKHTKLCDKTLFLGQNCQLLVVRLPEHKFYWERGSLTDPKGLKDNEA